MIQPLEIQFFDSCRDVIIFSVIYYHISSKIIFSLAFTFPKLRYIFKLIDMYIYTARVFIPLAQL